MMCFTEEEKMIIDIYHSPARMITVVKIQNAMPFVEDKDMVTLMKTVICKLLKTTDKEYAQMSDSAIS